MKPGKLKTAIQAADDTALAAIARGLAWAPIAQRGMNALCKDGLTLNTVAGEAFFRYYGAEMFNRSLYMPGWLHIRFQDVKRAAGDPRIDRNRLNVFSGKYNFMGLDEQAANRCAEDLARLAPAH